MITSRILALDPSKNATGFVIYEDGKILDYECLKFEHKIKKKVNGKKNKDWNIVDHYWEFFDYYYDQIQKLVRNRWITEIVSEFPHGSQSNTAAVSLQCVKDVIAAVGKTTNTPVTFIQQSEVKKHYFGKATNIPKERTIKEMSSLWGPKGYKRLNVGFRDEAVSDALLVLTKYLDL